MSERRVRRMGEEAWLVECEPGEAPRFAAGLRDRPVRGQVSVRVGAATVLVTVRRAWAARAEQDLRGREPVADGADPLRRAVRTIDVAYDGADLRSLAALFDMSEQALVDRHQAEDWTVAFCGFAPGFAYLRGWALEVPRLDSPRPAVPAGAVAVAGSFSAVYPTASPGGWRLLGRTAAPVWDVTRDPPALLAAGDRVRYRAVRETPSLRTTAPDPHDEAADGPAALEPRGPTLTVLEPGPLTLVEDLGRRGLEHLGVSPSGAADTAAARRANRLLGNDRGAALLETLGGLRLRAGSDLVIALTGAEADAVITSTTAAAPGSTRGSATPGGADAPAAPRSIDVPVPGGTPRALAAGEELRIGHPVRGLRVYVAVRGGLATSAVLGSRSTDVLGRLGPSTVTAGTVLRIGPARAAVSLPDAEAASSGATTVVRLVLGPRDDALDAQGLADLTGARWTVSSTSNRVGVRLEGARLGRRTRDELPSEPMVPGAIQVPPSGEPVVLLRDHPVTGGYPVVGVVLAADLDLLAQARPGDRIDLRVLPGP